MKIIEKVVIDVSKEVADYENPKLDFITVKNGVVKKLQSFESQMDNPEFEEALANLRDSEDEADFEHFWEVITEILKKLSVVVKM